MGKLTHLFKKNEKGQSLVEFALVAPILLLVVLGIVQFGIILNAYVSITHAAREGVRLAAVGGDESQVVDRTYNLAKTTGFVNLTKEDIIVSYMPDIDEEYDDPDQDPIVGDIVKIVIKNADVSIVVPLLDMFTGNSVAIASSATMRLEEGYRLAVSSPEFIKMKLGPINHSVSPNNMDLIIDLRVLDDNDQPIQGVFVDTEGAVLIRDQEEPDTWNALPDTPPGNQTLETDSSGNVTLTFSGFIPTNQSINRFELVIKVGGLTKSGYDYEDAGPDNDVYDFENDF